MFPQCSQQILRQYNSFTKTCCHFSCKARTQVTLNELIHPSIHRMMTVHSQFFSYPASGYLDRMSESVTGHFGRYMLLILKKGGIHFVALIISHNYYKPL
jgi:hypothetical protein